MANAKITSSKMIIFAISTAFIFSASACKRPEGENTQAETGENASSSVSSDSGKAAEDPKKLIDAKYLDEKYSFFANSSCNVEADDYLRSIAKYDFAWDESTKGFFGMKFTKYLSYVTAPGVLTSVSDRAKLQNGFGAFEHIELYCNYDTQKHKVLSFTTERPLPMADNAAPASSAPQLPSPTPTTSNVAPPPSESAKAPQSPAPDVQSGAPPLAPPPTPQSQPLGNTSAPLPTVAANTPSRSAYSAYNSDSNFDCGRPSTPVASTVCADMNLREQHVKIASIYHTLWRKADQVQRSKFAQEQLTWMAERDACASYDCIRGAYLKRLRTVTAEAWEQYNNSGPTGSQPPQMSPPERGAPGSSDPRQ